ncbi:MAG: helix-turn-helix domain-containing protein [Pseudomonadota bacterium]
MLSIGALSKRTKVKVPTIRYYEQAGLLDEPERTSGNQRRYSDRDVERLSFVRHARELGFPVEAIRELIELSDHPERPCDYANRIAAEQLAAVRTRIARLKRLKTELERIASGCSANTIGSCYVLDSLSDHSLCKTDHN